MKTVHCSKTGGSEKLKLIFPLCSFSLQTVLVIRFGLEGAQAISHFVFKFPVLRERAGEQK